ncbi:MAG: hypothetical protein ACFE98_08105 [Candidatus Hermodarchaeota archaeon]
MDKTEIHESIKKFQSKLDMDYDIGEWLTLADFPDDTRVNLTPRGRRFIFQKEVVLKSLEPLVSRAQWSRYRSNPEMSIPLSTIRLLVGDERELFMTSFTVTTIGNKKLQLPIKLPIRTRSNSLTKLLAHFVTTKNVFSNGTYQTDNREKVDSLIETFESVFDVRLCEEEIPQNQRGYYIKIPVQICTALVRAFTGEFEATVPKVIRSVAKCKDEQDILDFVITWLQISRIYRYNGERKNLYMFRDNDETKEIVKLLKNLEVEYEIGSIIDDRKFVQVYEIPKTEDNEAILKSDSVVSRLKDKIQNQEARIAELESIKVDLEYQLVGTTQRIDEKITWSRAMDERLADDLSEKLIEFERILRQTRHENEELKRILRERGTITPEESLLYENVTEPLVVDDLAQLREDVDLLKERLAMISHPASPGKELSYKVTQEITMKSEQYTPLGVDIDLRQLVKTFLAHPDNWILFILANQSLTKEQIRKILGIPAEKRMDLHKRLNDFVDRNILKLEISAGGEELYQIDRLQKSDLIGDYITTLLGNKELVPLEIRQMVRNVLR